jgi:phosphatidylglycerophosphatase A
MSAKTDPAASDDSAASSAAASTASSAESSSASSTTTQRKPRFAVFIATAAGLGYLPKAPGTWGSLAGLALAILPIWALFGLAGVDIAAKHGNDSFFLMVSHWYSDPFLWAQIIVAVLVAVIGVWSATRASQFWQQKDPQRVVIDEVSGQHLTLLLGCGIPIWWKSMLVSWTSIPLGLLTFRSALSWKYLLVGFILFRVFDIWKPFPARQAESLPGGWGIMTDDWIAGIYAAIGLWLARAAGL